MQRQFLLDLIHCYSTAEADEMDMRRRMLDFVGSQSRCFDRALVPGHVTGSAWIVNPARTQVLLTHHRKLNRWFQPGGHSDGDPNTRAVAWREAREETGLEGVSLVAEAIFDLDIHAIPARKSEPEHFHYDVRFLFEANDAVPLVVSEESNDLAWVGLHEVAALNNERSMQRMVAKTLRLDPKLSHRRAQFLGQSH